MIAPTGRGGLVGRPEQSLDFRVGEIGEHRRGRLLGLYGQDPRNHVSVFGMLVSRVGEERMNGSQTSVAGPDRVLSNGLQICQECSDRFSVHVGELDRVRRRSGRVVQVKEEHSEGIPVSGDGVLAGRFLAHQECCEEGLQRDGERTHGRSP